MRTNMSSASLQTFGKDHPDLQCFIRCVALKVNVYTEDGQIKIEEMKQLVHEVAFLEEGDAQTLVHEAVSKCMMAAGADDHCEKIGQYMLCKLTELDSFKLKKEYCPTCHPAR